MARARDDLGDALGEYAFLLAIIAVAALLVGAFIVRKFMPQTVDVRYGQAVADTVAAAGSERVGPSSIGSGLPAPVAAAFVLGCALIAGVLAFFGSGAAKKARAAVDDAGERRARTTFMLPAVIVAVIGVLIAGGAALSTLRGGGVIDGPDAALFLAGFNLLVGMGGGIVGARVFRAASFFEGGTAGMALGLVLAVLGLAGALFLGGEGRLSQESLRAALAVLAAAAVGGVVGGRSSSDITTVRT